MPSSSVEVSNLLIRSRLLSAEDVRTLHQLWRREARDPADDGTQFTQWLVGKQYLTDYQAGLLLRGRVDHFFVGQYKILERLGKGRMAGVYRAVHQFGQVVAIKVLPPSKAKDPQLLARFQREARLALRLKHPNVVRTFQVGEADGLQYIVMEHLEGETLDDVLHRRGRLPPAESVHLVYQALLGLQHVHEQGLVHRDLTPGNLMLVGPGQATRTGLAVYPTVKILDIGLGRALFDEDSTGAGDPDNYQLTNVGDLLGTPDYLAPEQARSAHQADIRADIYGLGCVLYHCLCGQPPFPGNNLTTKLVRHATEMPRPVREVNPSVPEGLQLILNGMLAKAPEERYPTPERAAQALQGFLAAGAELPHEEIGPQMTDYLNWLDSLDGSPNAGAPPLPPPLPGAVPSAIPVAAAWPANQPVPAQAVPLARVPARAPAPAAPSYPVTPPTVAPAAAPVPQSVPVEKMEGAGSPAPAPRKQKPLPAAPAPARKTRTGARDEVPEEAIEVEEVDTGPAPARRRRVPEAVEQEPERGWSGRDYLLLGAGATVGAAVLLVVEWVVYFLTQ